MLVLGGIVACSDISDSLTIDQISQLKQIRLYSYSVGSVKVKNVKEGFILDDKLVGIYDGHVDLGVDFDDFKSTVSNNGKSVAISTKIIVLNSKNGFINKAPQYMEEGTFSNAERAQLDSLANVKILELCKSEGGFTEAQNNAREKFIEALRKMGFEEIVINFEK